MGFPEPYDWNQNGKVDTEDWIIEEEQRRLSEERRKQQEKKSAAFPDPPPTESETRQGIRAWIALGISAAVFLFFAMLDMYAVAMIGTTAVLLLLAFFFVLPAGSDKD
jgi:hypothetical protein